jgi:hypothetical protein
MSGVTSTLESVTRDGQRVWVSRISLQTIKLNVFIIAEAATVQWQLALRALSPVSPCVPSVQDLRRSAEDGWPMGLKAWLAPTAIPLKPLFSTLTPRQIFHIMTI